MDLKYAIPLEKLKFCPDRPKRTRRSCLKDYDNGKYLAVSKIDGYNLMMCNDDGEIETYSRTWKHLPVCQEIKDLWKELDIPNHSVINCEWMKFRAGSDEFKYDGIECVYLLSPYVMDGLFVGHLPYADRRQWLESLGIPMDDLSLQPSQITSRLILPALAESDFESFFDLHTRVPRTEGLVLCKRDGRLVANQDDRAETKDMLRVKWRDGDAGRTEV